MAKKLHLVIIDPQNDFADSKGSLFVAGADVDMKDRLPKFIRRMKGKIADIHVTLDSHHKIDIAHPIFWIDSKGQHPNPFTTIKAADVLNGTWTTTRTNLLPRARDYVQALEKNNRYELMIWPEHCKIGSWGHNVVPELYEALAEWEDANFALTDYITKGSNIFTEHYSAVKAEVPDPTDPSTQLNTNFINTLENEADIVVVAGEASSHCVANTVRDIADNFQNQAFLSKIVLLTDAMSPVGIAKAQADKFIDDMKAKGVRLATTADYLASASASN